MELKQTILFLVNPFAGKGNALHTANLAIEKLNSIGFDTELFISNKIGDLSNFVNKYKVENISKVAVLGGDGTMNEIINSIILKPEWLAIPYLLFPCGTGNAFNHDMNCLTNEQAIEQLTKNEWVMVDLLEVKTSQITIWSFNIIGCGLVSNINVLAEKTRWLGAARYNIASLINIIFNKTIKAKVFVNNEKVEADFCFILACNTKYTGKGMKMAPMAKLNDGLIDLLIVKKTSRLKLFTLFPQVFSGKHIHSPILQYIQTDYFKVETAQNYLLNIDGEVKGNTPFEVIVHKQKLKVLTFYK